MTTEKWQLYSQAGVDGPEYGIRIRPGYTVVGFRKEDALAIVTWQNASIQPEGDIMEKAKALRNAALPRRTYSIPGQTGYGNPSLSKGWDFSAVDELVRVVVLELITEVERLRAALAHELDLRNRHIESLEARIKELEAEVEAKNKQIKELQDIIDKPPEDADWVADYHLLQSALDGPIIDAARKWHAAYRKAQNSNLMRAKEVERLRSHHIQIMGKIRAWILNDCAEVCRGFDWRDEEISRQREEIDAKDARIKELEALNELNHKNMRSWLDTTTDKEFLDKLSSEIGFKDAYIKRLEAAFLEATKEIVYAIHEGRDAPEGEDVYAEKEAREALERIRNGE